MLCWSLSAADSSSQGILAHSQATLGCQNITIFGWLAEYQYLQLADRTPVFSVGWQNTSIFSWLAEYHNLELAGRIPPFTVGWQNTSIYSWLAEYQCLQLAGRIPPFTVGLQNITIYSYHYLPISGPQLAGRILAFTYCYLTDPV